MGHRDQVFFPRPNHGPNHGPNHEPSRRAVLHGGAALLVATGLGPLGCAQMPRGRFPDDPFTLGIASGDPLADGVVLWTRLAPEPFTGDGGMGHTAVPVRWQVAHDPRFTRLVREGTATAMAAMGHTIHAEVSGLEPARSYYYRFIAGGVASPVGRTRTTPAPGTMPTQLRFANVGCQHYETGFYGAYAHLAREELDLVVHTGDYIYEKKSRKRRAGLVRWHQDFTCSTLNEYRRRYALYKSDPDLQAAHAAHPFAIVCDDHEVRNNWAGDMGDSRSFMKQRAAGFQAWWEHMPIRRSSLSKWAHMQIYRGLEYGALARINLCDTRQYRTMQPCGGGIVERCGEDSNPAAQMLGDAQERWLFDRLGKSPARWNVIAQQIPIAELDRDRKPDVVRYNMDKWDGYQIPRKRLLTYLAEARINNPIVLSGDIHHHLASELRPDFQRPETPAVASEFVNTSISSKGDGKANGRSVRAWVRQNPHVKYAQNLRGYVRHTVTAKAWQAYFRVVEHVHSRDAAIRDDKKFVLEAGRPTLLTA
jgi:alkaline phosphatase D